MPKAWWLCLIFSTGCAAGFSPPDPVEYDTVVVQFDPNTTVAAAADQLRGAGADLALVISPQDTAWLRQLAAQTRLISTRPGRSNNLTLAFLATKPEGDTTLTIAVPAGGRLQMHDALYKFDKNRWLDLMTVLVEPGTPARDAVRALLAYIATDVRADAVTVLAVQAPGSAAADSIADLTRAVWADASECTAEGRRGERRTGHTLRLFYFPPARVDCTRARQLSDARGTAATLRIR